MTTKGLRALVCAAALGTMALTPTQAAVVTFDDLAPNLFVAGESFSSGGFKFAPDSGLHQFLLPNGFTVVDTAVAYAAPPTGNATQFAGVLNDGSVTMTSSSDFTLAGFDFGFIAPVPGSTGSVGMVVIAAVPTNGGLLFDAFDFGQANQSGNWAFNTASLANSAIAGRFLTSVTFYACLYDGGPNNSCTYPALNLAQFAIDNITTQIPEPGSLALAVAAVCLAVAARRRRAA